MSAILDRLPALATTGVGSLPFARPAEAARHALGGYAVPFCPQLPRLDGDMVSEWLGTDPGRCGWTTDRDRERPAACDAFVEQLAAKPPDHGIAKLQVTGPVTLAIALERGAGRVGAAASVVSLARDVCVWLAANAAGQVRRLAEVGIDALVVVDEPDSRTPASARSKPSSGIRCDPCRPRGGCTCVDGSPGAWSVGSSSTSCHSTFRSTALRRSRVLCSRRCCDAEAGSHGVCSIP